MRINRLKFKFYPQLESIDCGPACIAMLAVSYGKKVSLDTVKRLCSVTRLGVSVQDLLNGIRTLGFQANAYRLTEEELEQAPLPVILHWKQQHFIVLYEIKVIARNKARRKMYKIADPAYGKISLEGEILRKEWMGTSDKGVAILAIPSEGLDKTPIPGNQEKEYGWEHLKPVFNFLSATKFRYSLSFLLIGITMLANWVMPFILQKTIDDAILGKQLHILWMLLLAQFGLFVGSFLSQSISDVILTKGNFLLTVLFRKEFLYKLIRLPVSYFDTRINTETLQRLEDHNTIQKFLTWKGIDLIFNITNLLIFGTVLFVLNKSVFVVFFVLSVLSILWISIFLQRRAINEYSMFLRQAENSSNLYEFIMNMPEIKGNFAQKNIIGRILSTQEKLNELEIRSLFLNMYQNWGSNLLTKLKELVALGFSGYLIVQNQMTLGVLMSITFVIGQLSAPVRNLIHMISDLQNASIANKRVRTVYSHHDEKPQNKKLLAPESFHLLQLDNVSFKYPGSFNPIIFKDISFELRSNHVTALVGPSGSGKTTLLKLILSFYSPTYGSVLLNGKPLEDYDVDLWRQCCGVVMQDGHVFNGTIAENIAFSSGNPDFERIAEATEIACLDNFIQSLPMGYHTKVGSTGIQLSGGQKQRLLIARAVYKNPDVLLFDEATSSLDAVNERRIMENLIKFFSGKAVFIIAHRLSTVKNANHILVLNNGKIVEQGRHDYLALHRGHYFELVKNQLELGT